MASSLLLLPFLFSLAAAAAAAAAEIETPTNSSSSSAAMEGLSAYDVLQSYNFPKGLLPQGALGYDLDRTTGKFSAYFNGSCSFSIESYKIRYETTITGRISTNRLTDLRGISVKLLVFWLNFVEVVRDGEDINFSVGITYAGFPVGNFYVCPQCGCGLDCGTTSSRLEEGFRNVLVPSI